MRHKIAVKRLKEVAGLREIQRVGADARAIEAAAKVRVAAAKKDKYEYDLREKAVHWSQVMARPSLALEIVQTWSAALVQSANRTEQVVRELADTTAVLAQKAGELDAATVRSDRAADDTRRALRAYWQSREDKQLSDAQILRTGEWS
jgi:hypothetical protein